ncbi:hypothetical protein FRC19_006999 [Serendipita sp. 401]|nr:hypothetical protein FRC19_006999 [Serendipita sp. 401]KAG8837820.1 hypothetical protein FRC18_007858 [Serendipita sp. 400]KAG8867372.1 hypothetical protein FRC20_005944 [Serendipita sp. 405]KAG9057225.1 hypothetical protein FS842_008150 [Serendipita sp. 407]
MGYDTPSDDESGGTVSPVDVEPRDSQAPAGSTKKRMAPSGSSQREAKSRRTGEPGEMTAPGQGQGPSTGGSRGPMSGGHGPPGYGSQSGLVSQGSMGEEGYAMRQKREEFVDQKLMDELKKELGDPLMAAPVHPQGASGSSSRPPAS